MNRIPNANGEKVADYINTVIWGKNAENVCKYCTKGSKIAVEGRIQTRSYNARDGSKKYITEVVVNHVQFLGKSQSTQNVQTQAVQTQEPAQVQATVEEDPFSSFAEENNLDDVEWPFE